MTSKLVFRSQPVKPLPRDGQLGQGIHGRAGRVVERLSRVVGVRRRYSVDGNEIDLNSCLTQPNRFIILCRDREKLEKI